MVDKNQANFRIDSELWQSFREKASANGSNATAELNRFIQLYVDGEIPLADFRPNTPENLDKRIGESIQAAVVPLEAELALLKKRLGILESNQGSKIVTVEAITTNEEKIVDIPENSPSRMASNARSEGVTANHPGAITEAVKAAKSGRSPFTPEELAKGLNSKLLAKFLGMNEVTFRSDKHAGKTTDEYFREKDPDGMTWVLDPDARWPHDKNRSKNGLWFRKP